MDRIKIETDVTLEDMHEISKIATLKNSFGRIKIFYVVLFALGYSSLFNDSTHSINGIDVFIYIVFVVVFYLVVVGFHMLFCKEDAKKALDNIKITQESNEKIISKEGLSILSKKGECLLKWSELYYIYESKNMYMLFFRYNSIYINKSAFKSYDDMHFFRTCLDNRKRLKTEETDDYIIIDNEDEDKQE